MGGKRLFPNSTPHADQNEDFVLVFKTFLSFGEMFYHRTLFTIRTAFCVSPCKPFIHITHPYFQHVNHHVLPSLHIYHRFSRLPHDLTISFCIIIELPNLSISLQLNSSHTHESNHECSFCCLLSPEPTT